VSYAADSLPKLSITAFDDYQDVVNADIEQVRLARARRNVFKSALGTDSDVVKVFGSGSLARSTQLAPIHDVDLVVVFDRDEHIG
jgi:tRNA nucleotidyltransferase (CCA-adding enzyme)